MELGERRPDRVALVTGASSGIGRAVAHRLARGGNRLVLVDLPGGESRVQLERTAAEALAIGAPAVAVAPADIRDEEALRLAVAGAAAEVGTVTSVVANAGIVRTGTVLESRTRDLRDCLEVNLIGAWNTVRCSVGPMLEQGLGGSVVIIGSTAGFRATAGFAAYGISKHAVIGLMRSLAAELGEHRVRVNAVHPSNTRTPMAAAEQPDTGGGLDDLEALARYRSRNLLPVDLLPPEAIAEAVAWLCSPASQFVTGTNLPVDAGFLSKVQLPHAGEVAAAHA
jgi:NAD(P)-dependent dehydrogenase (short-subunit alcohol dehydrogenase family)